MWTKHDDCSNLVKDVWKTKIYGCPMYILERKLQILKVRLKDWNKNVFGNVDSKVKEAEIKLKDIHDLIGKSGYNETLQDSECKAQFELEKALNIEEDLWREKSRIKWHTLGDRNTRFSHTYAKIRRKTNVISSLVINDKIVTDQKDLENHIVSHYENLFNTRFIP